MSDITKVMGCCMILHYMVVKEKKPLMELRSDENLQVVQVGDFVGFCFLRELLLHNKPIPGTIAAICATNQYIQGSHQYTKTRRLVYKKICGERKESKE